MQIWDKKGTLKAYRTPANRRCYTEEQYLKYIGRSDEKGRKTVVGYDWFETLCRKHNAEIVVLNNVETSPDKEMIDNMVSIVHVFSCRLPGLRKYQSKIANDKSLTGGESNDKDSKSKTVSQSNHEKGS